MLNDLRDSQQLYLDQQTAKSKLKKIVVKFWAEDPYGKREILMDGKKVVYAVPGIHCDHHIRVMVTSRPKPSMYTNAKHVSYPQVYPCRGGGEEVAPIYKKRG